MIHLYYGDGKGKTTAAAGLALRAVGRGWRTAVVQFLKDGASGEIAPLRRLGVAVFAAEGAVKFSWEMSGRERAEARRGQTALLARALEGEWDLLVLDEACGACAAGLVDEEALRRAVLEGPEGREVVLTGREPAGWMLAAADYATEMRCEKHPFCRGIPARRGVEF